MPLLRCNLSRNFERYTSTESHFQNTVCSTAIPFTWSPRRQIIVLNGIHGWLRNLISPWSEQVISRSYQQSFRETVRNVILSSTDLGHCDDTSRNWPPAMVIRHRGMFLVQCRFDMHHILHNTPIITKHMCWFLHVAVGHQNIVVWNANAQLLRGILSVRWIPPRKYSFPCYVAVCCTIPPGHD